MDFIRYRRRAKPGKSSFVGNISADSTPASVSRAVLVFLSIGLTNGAKNLEESYTPSSKAREFVDVSAEIIGALKRGYDNKFADDSVVISVKVNHKPTRIELTQMGRDVMLAMDNCAMLINDITLKQLYANMRNDMIRHPEIYGKDRHLTAVAYPEPT